jgi:hypothetical protein
MVRGVLLCAVGLVSLSLTQSTGRANGEGAATLTALQFLLGQWEGVGDQAGAIGGFTFAPSLQDHVIVRTNYSNTPANGTVPASRHDDLMVIYAETGVVRADYFDSESHVIRYVATVRPGQVIFVSESKPTEPRYRLIYTQSAPTMVTGTFEVAPPGKPDAFASYLSWTARRVK